jgi:hypothetical protein
MSRGFEMDQSKEQEIIIQVRGKVDKGRRKEDVEALIRLLRFAAEEVAAYGYFECEKHLFSALEELRSTTPKKRKHLS